MAKLTRLAKPAWQGKVMIEVRIAARVFVAALAAAALSACDTKKETGPDEAAPQDVPQVATPVVPAVLDPAAVLPLESFTGMDTDSDGLVSSAEYAKAAQTMFRLTDADRDGSVTVAEMDAAERAVGGSKAIRSDAPQAALPSSEKTIAVSDGDGDGQLTLAEYVGGSNGLFARMDANADARLNRAEWDAGHAMPAPGATPSAK